MLKQPSMGRWKRGFPRLVASNEALEVALTLLMDLDLARHGVPEDAVLRQVEDALNRAARAKSPF
jgi:hypothetical protein